LKIRYYGHYLRQDHWYRHLRFDYCAYYHPIHWNPFFPNIRQNSGTPRLQTLALHILICLYVDCHFRLFYDQCPAFLHTRIYGWAGARGQSSDCQIDFSQMVPTGRSAEFFGFLNVSSRFSSILGPFIFSLVSLLTGSARFGILSLFLFFAIGILLLIKVNLEKGAKEAIQASA
jgi:MFS-type transporter involved in bile tolerance (Atg22 family)